MTVTGLVHVNINCRDFDRSRAFYALLGFVPVVDVPPTNTPEVAAAVGLPPYRLRGALLALRHASAPLTIDLLEWQDPADDDPPYARANHLGIARIALATDDLDGDMAMLAEHGVEFLSAPATVALAGQPTVRFVCFPDPDGTLLELVEVAAAS